MPDAYRVAFRSGDIVRQIIDPRHTGRVRAVFNGMTVRVEWDDTKWLSDLSAEKLEKTTRN